MEIVKPQNQNYTYVGDASQGVADLPCRVQVTDFGDRTITSAWKPTEDELLKLLNGGTVELTVFGYGQPPVMLSVAPAQPDLFVEEPLHGVVGYVQKWVSTDGEVTYTFDVALEAANARIEWDAFGWEKRGEPFPVSKAIGYKSADRALAELQAAVHRAGLEILHTDSADGFPLILAGRAHA